jgi:quinol monooxygenase YgiN
MQHRVIEKYTSAYPNPIKFLKAEKLSVGDRDDEYQGWVRVTTKCGNEGWAPEQYITQETSQPKATEDYDATELSTELGEILVVVNILNEWAWAKSSSGQTGWVPCKTLEPITAKVILEGYIIISDEDLPVVLRELPIHIQKTKSESGCLVFNVQQQKENPNKFMVYEEFIDQTAFEFHQSRVKCSDLGTVTKNVQRHYKVTKGN